MAKKPPAKGDHKSALKDVKTDMLTEEEKSALRAKAQEAVKTQMAEDAADAYLEQCMAEERRLAGLDKDELNTEEVKVTIDLPEFAASIRLNSRDYFHGFTYTVPMHVYESMAEIMNNAWEHQSEIEGKTRNFYQKKKNPVLSARNQAA